ncbi:hypothetical protein NL676_013926 [Syzygium grande]|nr:hypothetical protein NL676_013926 [Syzygium grande]
MDLEPADEDADGDAAPELMELDDKEPKPIEEDPVPEAKLEDMVSEEEAAEAEHETDSSGFEEEMPDRSLSSKSSGSDPDWAP